MRVCLREKDICIYELNRCMYSNKQPINKKVGVLLFFFSVDNFQPLPRWIFNVLFSWIICLFILTAMS